MKSRNETEHWGREHGTAFWAAATLAVPVLLSVAVLLILLLEMAVTALDVRLPVSRVVAVAIVELVIAGGFICSAKKPGSWPAGVGTAGAIVGVFVLAGAAVTL